MASLAFKEAMGALAAAMAPLAYGIYVWKTLAGEARPHSDSVTTFPLNGLKFVPSLFAMETVSIATCVFPVTLLIAWLLTL